MRTTRLLVALALGSTAWLGCNREPPDITVDQARPIAEKEFSKWCNSEGFHCADFKAKTAVAKPPPEDPLFEWNFQWVAEQAARPSTMSVLVTKKGVPGVRLQALGRGDGSSAVAVAAAPAPAAAPKLAAPLAQPAAAQTASSKTPATAKAPVAATLAVVKTPVAPANPSAKDPAERTPPPLSTVPPPPPAHSAAAQSLEPTFREVFSACETEIGILCLSSPSSVPQARNCLRPHRAALRSSCGKVVGLKKGFDED